MATPRRRGVDVVNHQAKPPPGDRNACQKGGPEGGSGRGPKSGIFPEKSKKVKKMAVQGCAGRFFDVFWGFRDPPPGGSKSDKKKHDFQSFKKRIQILVEAPALVSPRGPVCS